MKKNKIVRAILGTVFAGALVGVAIAGGNALKGHPNLEKARTSINKAYGDCQKAKADEKHGEFGGHRDAAEKLLNQAKGELDQAATYANAHP